MNKRKQRLKNKQREQRREARMQARLARGGGRIARWKIVVPAVVFLFVLHCRFWHAEETWLMHTVLGTAGYQSLTRNLCVAFVVLGICGWMLYARSHNRRNERKESRLRWLGINLLYGFFWGAGMTALCTNVVLVGLFWLNARFASEVKPYEYEVTGFAVHDRKPKSHTRYSGAWLLNTFSYGEIFIKSDKYKRVHVSPRMASQFGTMKGYHLKMELADGCLGWGVVKRIDRIATLYPQQPDDVVYIDKAPHTDSSALCAPEKKAYTFTYTWQDIHIFARLRSIDLSDTAHVSVNRYVDSVKDIPVWKIDVRDSVQPDLARVILIHGETGEVLMDSYE